MGSGGAVSSPILIGLPKAFPSLMTFALRQSLSSAIIIFHIKELCVSSL